MAFLDKTTRIAVSLGLISGASFVLINPKHWIWRLVLLGICGITLIDIFVESDWTTQRQENLSVVHGLDVSLPSRNPIRATLAVISAIMLTVAFGITTWEVEKPNALELRTIVNPSPPSSGNPPVIVKDNPKLPRPEAPSPNIQPEIQHQPIKKQPPQPTIIQTQAPYGNLAARCDELGNAIISTADWRLKSRPDPATNRLEYNDW
jgi:hypothetical protein